MARDQDWDSNRDDNFGGRGGYADRSGGGGRNDYGREDLYGDARGYRNASENRSWQGRDRYSGDQGGQGASGGGHGLEAFGRGRIGDNDLGRRGYGQTGVGQNANDQGGVSHTGFSQSGYNLDDYRPSRAVAYGDQGGRDEGFGSGANRSGGYGGRDSGFINSQSRYLDDIADGRTQGEHRGRGPKNYTRSDSRIAEDVNDRLSEDGHLNASDIEVSVESAEVTLNGTVDSRQAKRRAEDLADHVSGVKHVQNNLRVADRTQTMSSISTDAAEI
jgi:hypothetical protein